LKDVAVFFVKNLFDLLLAILFLGFPVHGAWLSWFTATRMDMSMEGREGVLQLFPSPIYRKRLRSDGSELKALNEEIAVNFKRLMVRDETLGSSSCFLLIFQ
jgi:hypothetical protein